MADLESVISNAVEDAGVEIGADSSVDAMVASGGDESVGAGTTSTETATSGGESTSGEPLATPVEGAGEATTPVEDAFAKEHGITPTKPGQRENRLPYSRVKAIVGNAEAKIAKAVLGADPAADKPVLEQVTSHVKGLTDAIEQHKSKVAQMDQIEPIMERDPDRFMQMLAVINPGYRKYLDGARGTQPAETTAQPKADAMAEVGPMPEPDMEVPGGGKTYSLEGLKKLLDWNAKIARAEAKKEAAETLKPWTEFTNQQARIGKARDYFLQQVKFAETNWTGFKDHAPEILSTLEHDPTGNLSLFDAYLLVRDKKDKERMESLTADRNKMRQEILAELKKAPAATATTPASAAPAKSTAKPGTRSLEAIIAEQVSRAQRG